MVVGAQFDMWCEFVWTVHCCVWRRTGTAYGRFILCINVVRHVFSAKGIVVGYQRQKGLGDISLGCTKGLIMYFLAHPGCSTRLTIASDFINASLDEQHEHGSRKWPSHPTLQGKRCLSCHHKPSNRHYKPFGQPSPFLSH